MLTMGTRLKKIKDNENRSAKPILRGAVYLYIGEQHFVVVFVSLGMIHIAEFDIFEIIGDNFNRIGMSLWRL